MVEVVYLKVVVHNFGVCKKLAEKFIVAISVLFCVMLCFVEIAAAGAGHDKINNAYKKAVNQKIVDISARKIEKYSGLEIARYSVAVFENNQLTPIPFQIDEYNVEGTVFFPKARIPVLGNIGLYDGDDRLLFLLSDAGSQMPEAMKSDASIVNEGVILAELKISEITGVRYVYLLLDNKMRSPLDYVRYDPETGYNETDYYTLSVNPKNVLEWTDFTYYSYYGPNKHSILDTLKLRISGRILANMASITLTNKNLKAKRIGYVDGPIRSVVQLRTSVVIAKIPVMKIYLQIYHYPRKVYAITRTKTPRVIPYLFRDPTMRLSIDANDMIGSKLYTALQPLKPALVDGFLSSDEADLIEHGIDKEHNWLLLQSQYNFQILTSIEVQEQDETPVSLLYQDDAKLKNKPERFVGQLPNFGYVIRNIPMATIYYLGVNIYFDDSSTPYYPAIYAEQIKSAPGVTVIDFDTGG